MALSQPQPKNLIVTFGGDWCSISRDFDAYVSQEPTAGTQLLYHINLDHSKRPSSMVDEATKDAYQWVSTHYGGGDNVFIFSFTNDSYLALKALAKLLWSGGRSRSSSSGANIPIRCMGAVYDNRNEDRRIIDDMVKEMPCGANLLLGFELSWKNTHPDACAVLQNHKNGANLSRELWYFDRSVEVSRRVIMEWIAVHIQSDIKFNEMVGYFRQPAKWKQKIRDQQPSYNPSTTSDQTIEPAGLDAYELHMYDHTV
ncbi:hypothetical protein BDV93DRAFT_528307, partial [Ceratobasidium sp. AG-I]